MAKSDLDRLFNPRSVAVVGDKKETNYMWLRSLSTFQGKVFSVQIDPREIPGIEGMGIKNYTSLLDIPGPVDYVIVAVPRAVALKIVADCIHKQVGGAMLFTAGFAESNTEEGTRLQKLLTEMATGANLKLVGPNCVGIFNPRIGLRHLPEQYSGDGGSVGFISQSGTEAGLFSILGRLDGVRVSKSVSYGNGVVLNSPDYLEYLAQDGETRIIGIYIEGVGRDGRRFYDALKEAARRKPVLVWKGGQTEAGKRATASHTASLAGSSVIWQAVIRQCGAIKVDSLEQMIDTVKLLLYARPVTGDRVGLVAMSGGQSVVITDAFARAGLEVPRLSEESYREFSSFFDIIGRSYQNPLDISLRFFWDQDAVADLVRILDILGRDRQVDSIVLELAVSWLAPLWQKDPQFFDSFFGAVSQFMARCAKPLLIVLISGRMEQAALETRDRLVQKGIASFPSFDRAAAALRKMVEYYRSNKRAD